MYGYDSTNNKHIRITSSSDGKVNFNNIEKTLKQYRREGKCFYCSTYNFKSAITDYLLTLWNPSDSGYKIGLYNVQFNTSISATSGNVLKFTLDTFDNPTIGSFAVPTDCKNVKLGHPNDTDIEAYDGLNGYTTFHGNLGTFRLEPSTSSGGMFQYLDFQEEIIELPEGSGVQLLLDGNNDKLIFQYGVTFRYVKIPNNEEL